MTKKECQTAIRSYCHEWAQERGIPIPPVEQPSFPDFKAWLGEKGYSQCLNFRSIRDPEDDAEMWFDDEFKQNWRN